MPLTFFGVVVACAEAFGDGRVHSAARGSWYRISIDGDALVLSSEASGWRTSDGMLLTTAEELYAVLSEYKRGAS